MEIEQLVKEERKEKLSKRFFVITILLDIILAGYVVYEIIALFI